MHLFATTILAGAAAAVPAPAIPLKTPYFSIVREGPGTEKAFQITNPLDEEINLSRLAVGRKFSASKPELIIPLNDEGIREPLYDGGVSDNSVLGTGIRRNFLYCDGQTEYGWWGDYDVCDWVYQPLTDFNEDDVLKLYLDGKVVDTLGDESNLKVNDVCGIPRAITGKTLVRKESVTTGNPSPLGSFGTDASDCEWVVRADEYLVNSIGAGAPGFGDESSEDIHDEVPPGDGWHTGGWW